MIDYKELLIKYMVLVATMEGTYFTSYIDEMGNLFSKEEKEILKTLVKEADKR